MLEGPRPCTIFCFPFIHYAWVTWSTLFYWLVPQVWVNNYCVLCRVKAKKRNNNIQQRTWRVSWPFPSINCGENAVTGIWDSCRLPVMGSWYIPALHLGKHNYKFCFIVRFDAPMSMPCIIHLAQFREHAVVLRHRCTIVTPTPMSNSRNYEKTGHYLSARGCLGSFW